MRLRRKRLPFSSKGNVAAHYEQLPFPTSPQIFKEFRLIFWYVCFGAVSFGTWSHLLSYRSCCRFSIVLVFCIILPCANHGCERRRILTLERCGCDLRAKFARCVVPWRQSEIEQNRWLTKIVLALRRIGEFFGFACVLRYIVKTVSALWVARFLRFLGTVISCLTHNLFVEIHSMP